MSLASLEELLEFAVGAATSAGQVTLAHYQSGVAAEIKPDATPVTVADREAERLIRALIEARFPDDGIMGEEFGSVRPAAARRWILDPIDGTRSYVRGVPLFGVLIALEQDDEVMLGVAHFPALRETVAAARGLGCRWNGRRASVSGVGRLEEALVLTTDAEKMEELGHGPAWNRLRSRAGTVRTWGDCYGHILVATGRAEAMLDPVLAPWDVAALFPIVEEAGGVFTDWDGKRTHRGGSGIATNAAVAAEVRAALAGSEAER
jgi:histidinol-phosphatase